MVGGWLARRNQTQAVYPDSGCSDTARETRGRESKLTPEARLKKKVLAYLKSLEPRVWHTVLSAGPYSRRGLPDIVGCVSVPYRVGKFKIAEGSFFAIELKSPTGKPTHLQLYTLARIQEAGAAVLVAKSIEEVKAFMEGLM